MPNPLHAVADAFEGLLEHLYVHAILRPSFRGTAVLHEKIEGVRKMADEMDEGARKYVEPDAPVDVAIEPVKPTVEPASATVEEAAKTDEPVAESTEGHDAV